MGDWSFRSLSHPLYAFQINTAFSFAIHTVGDSRSPYLRCSFLNPGSLRRKHLPAKCCAGGRKLPALEELLQSTFPYMRELLKAPFAGSHIIYEKLEDTIDENISRHDGKVSSKSCSNVSYENFLIEYMMSPDYLLVDIRGQRIVCLSELGALNITIVQSSSSSIIDKSDKNAISKRLLQDSPSILV